jgi:hypothetical protein
MKTGKFYSPHGGLFATMDLQNKQKLKPALMLFGLLALILTCVCGQFVAADITLG